MSRLSACYFCGVALDEPLAEVALDPDAADPTVVTLCPGCREKLETVLEAAAGGDGLPDARDAGDGGPAETGAGIDREAEPADPSEAGDDGAGSDGDAAAAAPADEESTADDAERSIVEGDQEISALEYNKVMRLLQNREFPVDRAEIVTVAANAYEVSRRDCDRVIDAAIERGLLAEDEAGQLVRAE